jgi:hypothetical protein
MDREKLVLKPLNARPEKRLYLVVQIEESDAQ